MLNGEAMTAQLAEWCWARRLLIERQPIEYRHRKATARAARSIGAVRIRRLRREWLWMLPVTERPCPPIQIDIIEEFGTLAAQSISLTMLDGPNRVGMPTPPVAPSGQ